MKTEYQIYMDFNLAMEQVERLRSIASRIRSLANDEFGGTLKNIGENWSGENADSFLSKGDILKGKVSGTANDLERVAEAISTIAQRTRDAELAAIATASD